MILDNLGLTIDLSDAYDAYAKTVGKTAEELSKAEQQQAVLNAVVAQGDDFIAKMGGELGGSQMAMAQLSTTVGNLKDALGTALLPVLTAILTPLSEWATKHGPAITAWGMQFADWVITKGLPALQALAGFIISDIIPPLVQLAEAVFPLLVQAGEWVAENWDVVKYAAGALGVAILALTSPVTAIIVALSALYLAWTNDWGGIKTFVIDTIEDIKGVLDSIGAKVDDMKAIGKALIEGLWKGLESMKDWLKSKLQAIAGWLPQWIKDKLGISSPSKVFMQLGANMMQGMTAGITQNAGSVTRALGAAVSGFNGPAFAGAGAGVGGGTPTIIVVNLDRRDFEGPDGELDYGAIGQQVMGGRLY
jgi:phage-related protein